MRRLVSALLVVLMLTCPVALAEPELVFDAEGMPLVFGMEDEAAQIALNAALAAEALPILRAHPDFALEHRFTEALFSLTITYAGTVAPRMEGVQTLGFTYDLQTGARLSLPDLIGAEGVSALEALAASDLGAHANAYSEYNAVTPLPTDSFAILGNQLIVYYPADQLSYFSGRSGAYAFYGYEADALAFLPRAVPDAAEGLAEALQTGGLPAPLDRWRIGVPMRDAVAACGLLAEPDYTFDHAVYQFEAPEMRGVWLLAAQGEDNPDTATIVGVRARRIDFYGLQPGVSAMDDCLAALGEPDGRREISAQDAAYAMLPEGETIVYAGETCAAELHFADKILYCVTIVER